MHVKQQLEFHLNRRYTDDVQRQRYILFCAAFKDLLVRFSGVDLLRVGQCPPKN